MTQKLKLFKAVAALVLPLILASCSTLNLGSLPKLPITKTKRGVVKSGAVKPDKNKEKTSGPTVELGVMGNRPTEEELGGAQWIITTVGNTQIDAEDDAPYIHFQPSAGRFYASDGCNILNGDYVLRSDGVLCFSNTVSTRKYCPDIKYSTQISEFLSGRANLSADCRRIGQETYLVLRDSKGVACMTLRRHNMEFMNGNWRVASIDGRTIDGDECNIFFDIAELRLHGNTGCNYFNGDIYIDPTRSNSIDFSNMGVTRMACPNTARETAMLVALEQTASAIAGKDDDSVLLLDHKGKELMILKRIPLPEEDKE